MAAEEASNLHSLVQTLNQMLGEEAPPGATSKQPLADLDPTAMTLQECHNYLGGFGGDARALTHKLLDLEEIQYQLLQTLEGSQPPPTARVVFTFPDVSYQPRELFMPLRTQDVTGAVNQEAIGHLMAQATNQYLEAWTEFSQLGRLAENIVCRMQHILNTAAEQPDENAK